MTNTVTNVIVPKSEVIKYILMKGKTRRHCKILNNLIIYSIPGFLVLGHVNISSSTFSFIFRHSVSQYHYQFIEYFVGLLFQIFFQQPIYVSAKIINACERFQQYTAVFITHSIAGRRNRVYIR